MSEVLRTFVTLLAIAVTAAGELAWSVRHIRGETIYDTAPVTRGTVAPYIAAAGLIEPMVAGVAMRASESYFGDVQLGDDVNFTVDSQPGRVFIGRVAYVGAASVSFQGILSHKVIVDITNADPALRGGMKAAVRIFTDRRNDVVRVPSEALRYAPRSPPGEHREAQLRAHLWILRNGQPVSVPVELGIQAEDAVEITGGQLKPGDSVIVADHTRGTTSMP